MSTLQEQSSVAERPMESFIEEALRQVQLTAPRTYGNLTVYPLLRPTGDHEPDYITLGGAIAEGLARITELSEAGTVATLAIQNDADRPVLLVDGEELVGAKQNRVVNLTILAPAKHRLPIPVSCVEAGRWSYRGSHFDASPRTMAPAARARKTRDVNDSLHKHGGRNADQGAVWKDVDDYAAALGVRSPTAAMSDVFEQRRDSVEEYVSAFAPLPTQVGAVFAIGNRPVGVELFDSAQTFRTYFPKLLRGYAIDAILRREPVGAEPNGRAEAFLQDVSRVTARRFKAIGLGHDLRIQTQELVGAALCVGDRVVHLTAFAKTGM